MRSKTRRPAYYTSQIRRKLRDYDTRLEFDMRQESIKHNSHTSPFVSRFNSSRGYFAYNKFFGIGLYEMGLGNDIAQVLANIPRERGKPLEILEDGPGTGRFLGELKTVLTREKVNCAITAVDAHFAKELTEHKTSGVINRLVTKPAELFTPRKKYGAIFSLMGSVHYTTNALRKSQLLKLAYSLKKGGIMLVGFNFVQEKSSSAYFLMNIMGGFSENPNEERVMPIRVEMDGIKRVFQKKGFAAHFCPYPFKGDDLPNWMLILKRER